MQQEQYYPTYTFDENKRDVVLIEFEEAQKIANGQTKVYAQLTNIIIAGATILISIITSESKQIEFLKENELVFGSLTLIFGAILLRYFVDIQKQITINARKVVTLRTMLGLNYGKIRLTLPENRVEGASNPFLIKYFTGWFKFQTLPFWIISAAMCSIWYVLSRKYQISFSFNSESYYIPNLLIFLSILGFYIFVFRTFLLDAHETKWMFIIKGIAKILNFGIVENFENIIYRSKLQVIEMKRLEVNYENLKAILIEIEDSTFFQHNGVNNKAFIRGILSNFKVFRNRFGLLRSGGSTITMQLVRSLFFKSLYKKYRRKLFEVLFAVEYSKTLSKTEILDLYIVSVRYAKDIFGIGSAIIYFFGRNAVKTTLSIEESFVLVERLSNSSGKYDEGRIDFLLTKITKEIDKTIVKQFYEDLLSNGKIIKV